MVYVQFLTLNTRNEPDTLCGSDGVFILDGRNKMETWVKDAFKRIHQLQYVQKNIVGFKIIKGHLREKGETQYIWLK